MTTNIKEERANYGCEESDTCRFYASIRRQRVREEERSAYGYKPCDACIFYAYIRRQKGITGLF